jgi:hypothetical protein
MKFEDQQDKQVSHNFGILHNDRNSHYDHENIIRTETVLAANIPQTKQSSP